MSTFVPKCLRFVKGVEIGDFDPRRQPPLGAPWAPGAKRAGRDPRPERHSSNVSRRGKQGGRGRPTVSGTHAPMSRKAAPKDGKRAIISVAHSTSDYGAEPQRPKPCNSTEAGCPYDSLNVGAEDAPSAGSPGSYPLPGGEPGRQAQPMGAPRAARILTPCVRALHEHGRRR
jgi:hypothetical protein